MLTRKTTPSILAATAMLLLATAPFSAVQAQRRGTPSDSGPSDPFAKAVGNLHFRSIGPAVISGRVIDLAVDPNHPSTWYVATAAGGLWKTTNAGTDFTPIFDHEGSFSIGSVVIDPNNSDVVWVGTGENNAQRAVAYGDGVYKSIDGGRSWQKMGLKGSEHIGKILIDPRNSDVVYVAAQGPVFGAGGDRGLFKTTDGGKSWSKVLDGGEWAGAGDAVMDPENPDVLIVSLWQRGRKQWGYVAGGPESSLQRTTDGGKTWTKVQRGLPGGRLGRIGLAISPVNHDVVYAIVEAGGEPGGGFYRSQDNGASWHRMSDESTSGNYYAELFTDPTNVNRVYSVDTRLMVTDDGGRSFHSIANDKKHVDNHIVWIDPNDAEHLLVGCDGGLYQSFDGGQTYDWFQNLPLGQFYRVAVDNAEPFFNVYGGTQDNSSIGGPSRTHTRMGAINADWHLTQGGDGFYSRVDPQDPNIVYSEAQYGALARFNLATGESTEIGPEPEPGEPALRWHWDAPLIISPFSHTRLYFAAQRLYRSDDRGDSWQPVSPDLSSQIDRNKLKIMGRVWGPDALGKNSSTSTWNSIVSLAESPLKEGLLWVGTDDGMIQVSENGGQSWRAIPHVPGVPDTTFVSRVTPSAFDTATVYASFDNHKDGDYHPYIAKSTDLGHSWKVISGDLPERGSVYVVIEDTKNPSILYAGTEFGLFVTMDGGQHWVQMKGGLPTIQVRDITIQKRDDALVLATFGRGFYVLDHLSELRALDPATLASDAALLPVARTPMFIQSTPDPDWQGERFFTAENPPHGAQILYYVKDAIRNRQAQREAADLRAERAGKDVYYPSWDTLRAEAREEKPAMVLTISDPEGRVVRELTGPTSAGIQRVTWDLRYPSMSPITSGGGGRGGGGFFGGGGAGPYVVPGTYTVSLAERADGVTTQVGQPQKFEVYLLDDGKVNRTAAALAFQKKAQELQRAMLGANAALGEATTRAGQLRQALERTPNADSQITTDLRALQDSLEVIQVALNGDRTRARYNEPTPPALMSRLRSITGGAWSSSLEGPGGEQEHQYEILSSRFGPILERLRQFVDVDLKKIEDAAEAAGAPWTSGRIPRWHQ